MKRSPLDIRRPLGIAAEVDAATVAHVLRAHARLGREGSGARAGGDAGGVAELAGRLLELRCAGYEEPCWGYHFDVETRFFFYGRGTPNTIATAFAGHALLDAHALTADPTLLGAADGVGEFFLRRIGSNLAEGGAFFGYFPGDRTPIHNASLLAASFLARLAATRDAPGAVDRRPGADELAAAGTGAAGFALRHQRPDGSWPYAEDARGGWVDGFHTGYVLDALAEIAGALPTSELAPAIAEPLARGRAFFVERFLLADGTPRFRADSTYPIDGQSAAQAIRTLALAGRSDPAALELAWRCYAYAVAELRREDGAFAFQRHRLLVNRIAHPRWVEAPMLEALSLLLESDTSAIDAGAAAP